MSTQYAAKAKEDFDKAEKKINKGGGFMSFLSGGSKYEDALDLFQSSATNYKLAKLWTEAAQAYERCSFCAEKADMKTDVVRFLVEAGNAMSKVSPKQAAPYFDKAVEHYCQTNRLQQAAKLLFQQAQTSEQEEDIATAIAQYERARDLFDAESNSKSDSTKCDTRLAHLLAKEGQLEQAIELFEKIGQNAVNNTMLMYGAREHFMRATILHLAMGDEVTVEVAVEKYFGIDPKLAGSREGDLMQALSQAFSKGDIQAFVDALAEFDAISRLDAWNVQFLNMAKEKLKPAGAAGLGGEGAAAAAGGMPDLT